MKIKKNRKCNHIYLLPLNTDPEKTIGEPANSHKTKYDGVVRMVIKSVHRLSDKEI